MESFTTSFDIAAICLCIVCLVSALIRHQTDKVQNKLFIGLVLIIALGAISDSVSLLLQPATQETLMANRITSYTYFIFHAALAPTCFYYMICVAGKIRKYSNFQHFLILFPALLCELLVLSNPANGWTYMFDPVSFEYHRGWVIYLMYVVGVAYLAVGVAVVCRTWNALTSKLRNALLFYTGLVVFGVVLQMLVHDLRVELFAESLALMGMLLTIENEDGRKDMVTGVYARHVLLLDFDRFLAAGNPFDVICVQLTNSEFILRMVGQEGHGLLTAQIADYLKEFVPWFRIYRTSLSSFILVNFDTEKSDTAQWAASIEKRLQSPWDVLDIALPVRATVMWGTVPAEFPSGEEVLLMSDIPVPIDSENRVLTGSDLSYLTRRSQVEKAVARGLEDGNFEVYYQPICRADGTICAAEALLRLHDPEFGDVSPGEFIPVTEHNGIIERIGMFVLEEVCKFIASGKPGKAGVEDIHVNLSVVQCFDPDFADKLCEITRRYNVRPEQINLEITESVSAGDEYALAKMMARLREEGFNFSMDDYGTGYTSIHHIFAYDFSIVKVDKSVLWDASKGDDEMTALVYTMKMIQDTGRKSVVEGVETEDHIELLNKLGADYFQGFYYSKPLPESEFIAKAEELSSMPSRHEEN